MKSKKLTNGFELPVLGLGTWGIGGEREPDYSNDETCIAAIRKAIELGYTHIDTAEMYGGGHAEELVAKAIENYGRKKLIITTKVSADHLKYDDVITAAKNSLKRLKTDYIDLYLVHAPNPEIPIKETIEAMDFLVEQKMVRFIGVSNFNIEQMKEAQKYSKNKIVANELKYNLWAKFIDIKTIQYCQKNDILVLAYKPFARGKITKEKIGVLSVLSQKYNKSEAQIILSWLISKKNIVTIFKAIKFEHLKENLEALDFDLEKEDIEQLDKKVG